MLHGHVGPRTLRTTIWCRRVSWCRNVLGPRCLETNSSSWCSPSASFVIRAATRSTNVDFVANMDYGHIVGSVGSQMSIVTAGNDLRLFLQFSQLFHVIIILETEFCALLVCYRELSWHFTVSGKCFFCAVAMYSCGTSLQIFCTTWFNRTMLWQGADSTIT